MGMTKEINLIMRDYRLTTAEILYHLPDYPGVLQTYVWQDYDLAPQFPVLYRFLDYWSHNVEGRLHSVLLASRKLILPSDWRAPVTSETVQ